jgi:hypothetical protein
LRVKGKQGMEPDHLAGQDEAIFQKAKVTMLR